MNKQVCLIFLDYSHNYENICHYIFMNIMIDRKALNDFIINIYMLCITK